MERDFQELMKAFTDRGIQAFIDFRTGNPIILTTDWNKENITGVLSQVQEEQKRFLGSWGRNCNKYEQTYQSYKGELLVVK